MTTTDDRRRTVWDLRLSDPEWARSSACRLSDLEDWQLVTRTDPGTRPANQRARRICWECPVRRDCLVSAAIEGDEYAIRGALTPPERDGWLAEQGISRPRRSTTTPGIAKSTKKRQPSTAVADLRGYRREDVQPSAVARLAAEGMTYAELAAHFSIGRDTIRKRIRAWRVMQAAGGAK